MSKDLRGEAIEPRSLPIENPNQRSRDHAGKAPAEDVGQIMGADKNARAADEQCQKSENKCATGQAVKCKRRDNGDRRDGMIARKRPIRALGNDQVADAGVVGADPVDEEEDDLIDAKPDEKGQPGGNAGMPDMRPIDLTPPLADNEDNEERNAGLGGHNHDGIQEGIAAGDGIDPLRKRLIHLYRSLPMHRSCPVDCMNERRGLCSCPRRVYI